MKRFILWVDVYRQSPLFFKWNVPSVLAVLAASALAVHYWDSAFMSAVLDNIFVYFPNYLTHEVLGHNLVGNVLFRICYALQHPGWGEWLATLAGNGVETLVPFVLILCLLQLDGGRWGIPPLLYWFSSTFYGAGLYAADAKACSLPLTSSDMLTNYAPGEKCGDWHYILKPLGLLDYDRQIAYALVCIACVLLVFAVYSAWYYWTHTDQYMRQTPFKRSKLDDWQPPNIYTPQ